MRQVSAQRSNNQFSIFDFQYQIRVEESAMRPDGSASPNCGDGATRTHRFGFAAGALVCQQIADARTQQKNGASSIVADFRD